MQLTTINMMQYLLGKGLLRPENLVDGDFVTADVSRRNRNFKVIQKNDKSYFLKQINTNNQQDHNLIRKEATLYWLAQNDPGFKSLKPYIPVYYDFDPLNMVLITSLDLRAESLASRYNRTKKFPREVGEEIGTLMGTFHREITMPNRRDPNHTAFPMGLPWILAAHKNGGQFYKSFGSPVDVIGQVIGRFPELHYALESLYGQWSHNGFIHGDIKWDNFLINNNANDTKPEVQLVDWEISDYGDTSWDVGGLFQSFLTSWLMSIPINPDKNIAQQADEAAFPLEEMQPAIQAYWDAYTLAKGTPTSEKRGLLIRSIRYAACRLIQTNVEYMSYTKQFTPQVIYNLQLSANIFADPNGAITQLLGIRGV